MGKKYEQVGGGSYKVYREKKESGCGAIIFWIVVLFIMMAVIGSCAGN